MLEGGQHHALAALPPGIALLKGDWMVSRASLDGFWQRENPLRLLGMKPCTILPITDCYTDYAILAPASYIVCALQTARSVF